MMIEKARHKGVPFHDKKTPSVVPSEDATDDVEESISQRPFFCLAANALRRSSLLFIHFFIMSSKSGAPPLLRPRRPPRGRSSVNALIDQGNLTG